MKQTIEERAYKAVPDMLKINDNYVESFVSGYYRGATEERAEIKEYLEKKKASLNNYAQAMMFSPFINEIINELFGGK